MWRVHQRFGLNKPIPVQFAIYLQDVSRPIW
jgi:ABC-type dipeptide/oligopeptide/nickel transport system permease component